MSLILSIIVFLSLSRKLWSIAQRQSVSDIPLRQRTV